MVPLEDYSHIVVCYMFHLLGEPLLIVVSHLLPTIIPIFLSLAPMTEMIYLWSVSFFLKIVHVYGLAKNSFGFFCNILWKYPNELFDQQYKKVGEVEEELFITGLYSVSILV